MPSGDPLTLRITPSPLRIPEAGGVFVVRDVSLDRQATEARAFFIRQVSHELRRPLQHILSFVDLIDHFGLDSEDGRHYLRLIEEETHLMGQLVRDLVEFNQIEMGQFPIYPEPVRLDQWLDSVVARLIPRAQVSAKHLQLVTPLEVVWAMIDPLRIEQVLANLITNACEYASEGSRVQVSLESQEDQAVVSVQDEGPGIAPEDLGRIFDPFFRGGSSAGRPGMGLGLYISRQIVRALGGELWAHSEVGIGSTFSFRLPTCSPAPDDAANGAKDGL